MDASNAKIQFKQVEKAFENHSDFLSLLVYLKENSVFSWSWNEEDYIEVMCMIQKSIKRFIFHTLWTQDKTIKEEDIGILVFEILKTKDSHFLLNKEYQFYYKKRLLAVLDIFELTLTNEQAAHMKNESNKIESMKRQGEQETGYFSDMLKQESHVRGLLLKGRKDVDEDVRFVIKTLSIPFLLKLIE